MQNEFHELYEFHDMVKLKFEFVFHDNYGFHDEFIYGFYDDLWVSQLIYAFHEDFWFHDELWVSQWF